MNYDGIQCNNVKMISKHNDNIKMIFFLGNFIFSYLDRLPVCASSCNAWTRDDVCTLCIVGLVSLRLKPAEDAITPEFIFWSTLVWLLWLSWACEGTIGDARPTNGLDRWPPAWLFVKCWYKLPWLDSVDDETGFAVAIWAWFVTIVETVELLLELLLLFVGNCIPGTVVAEERGTDTTKLSSFVFTWTFCVITFWDLAAFNDDDDVDDDNGAETGGDVMRGEALEADVDEFEWMTFGLTFCSSGVAAAGVDCELKSVLA